MAKALRFSSLDFYLFGVLLAIVFPYSETNLELILYALFSYLVFYAGFSFRLEDFKASESLSYRVTLLDILSSLTLFGVTFFILTKQTNVLELWQLSYVEIFALTIALSTSSIGLIRGVNQESVHRSNLAKLAFDSVAFQQFVLLLFFVIAMFSLPDHNSKELLIILFFSSLLVVFLFHLWMKYQHKQVALISVLLLILSTYTVLEVLHISPFLVLFLLGFILGNTSKEIATISQNLAQIKEYSLSLGMVLSGFVALFTPLSAILACAIFVLRYLFKLASQELSASLAGIENELRNRFSTLFLSQGRLAIILVTLLYFEYQNSVYKEVLGALSITVLAFEFLGIKRYSKLLASFKTSNRDHEK